ncbi:hypothetical protein ZWY2020_049798 [Hordeum vulgare]|nr:hypothetical protein ZWY2020_049798 [Hordeum vulgare]
MKVGGAGEAGEARRGWEVRNTGRGGQAEEARGTWRRRLEEDGIERFLMTKLGGRRHGRWGSSQSLRGASMGIYITRWSAKRLREIANTVKEKKRDVISKSSFGDLLHISPLPPPPEALVHFIVMRIDTKKRLLKLNDHKKIQLTRDMVKKVFNVPSGSKPLEFGKRGKADFHEIYLEGERAPIPTTVYVLSNADDDDEDTINRTWILLCLSSTSPYATTKFMSYIEQLAQLPNKASMSATEIPDMIGADGVQQPTEGATNEANGTTQNVHEPPPKNTEGGDDVCGSLEDWLHPLPAFDELEVAVSAWDVRHH